MSEKRTRGPSEVRYVVFEVSKDEEGSVVNRSFRNYFDSRSALNDALNKGAIQVEDGSELQILKGKIASVNKREVFSF